MSVDGIYVFGHGPTSESVQKADMLTRLKALLNRSQTLSAQYKRPNRNRQTTEQRELD